MAIFNSELFLNAFGHFLSRINIVRKLDVLQAFARKPSKFRFVDVPLLLDELKNDHFIYQAAGKPGCYLVLYPLKVIQLAQAAVRSIGRNRHPQHSACRSSSSF